MTRFVAVLSRLHRAPQAIGAPSYLSIRFARKEEENAGWNTAPCGEAMKQSVLEHPRDQSLAMALRCGAFVAASMMTAATSFGFASIATWLVSNSVVVAFMRLAKKRS